MHSQRAPVVLLVNASDDVFEVLTARLARAGFKSLTARAADIRRGTTDLVALVAEHQPCAVIWDVALPYYRNWQYLELLRSSQVFGTRPVVVTSPNKASLDRIVGSDTGAIELVGEPDDLGRVLAAISVTAATV